jgi:hypothetical protein
LNFGPLFFRVFRLFSVVPQDLITTECTENREKEILEESNFGSIQHLQRISGAKLPDRRIFLGRVGCSSLRQTCYHSGLRYGPVLPSSVGCQHINIFNFTNNGVHSYLIKTLFT